jgi:hypothetical protein
VVEIDTVGDDARGRGGGDDDDGDEEEEESLDEGDGGTGTGAGSGSFGGGGDGGRRGTATDAIDDCVASSRVRVSSVLASSSSS